MMNDVGSLLEAQTAALLRRLEREQESRIQRIRDEAATEAADIVRKARTEARTRLHQAVIDARREDEQALTRRRAALDTQARRRRQATVRELLEQAWEALPATLLARWLDAAAREHWCEAACACARRSLRHLDRVQVEVDPQWLAHVGPLLRGPLAGLTNVETTACAGLGAGLRIRAGDACVDATLAGLLAPRERITSELLAEFDRLVASQPAEPAP